MARDGQNRPVRLFRFPRDVCAACRLRERCLGGPAGRAAQPVRQPPGRQVQLHYHEAVLQQARAAQRTPEQQRALRERLRPRAKVERKLAEVLRRHGLRQGRYLGQAKIGLQAAMTGALVNTKRLLTLASRRPEAADRLRRALVRLRHVAGRPAGTRPLPPLATPPLALHPLWIGTTSAPS